MMLWFFIELYFDRIGKYKTAKSNYRKTLDYSVAKDYRFARMKLIDSVFNILIISVILIGVILELYNSILTKLINQ